MESVYRMNENQSSEKGNDNYEKERLEVNKAILYAIQGFSRHTIQTSMVTLVMTVCYVPILLIYYERSVRACIIETGASIPLFILISTLIVEGKGRIMDWIEVKRARRRAEEKQREAKILAKGKELGRQELREELKAKGINVDSDKADSESQD